jgi:hypothetical protein
MGTAICVCIKCKGTTKNKIKSSKNNYLIVIGAIKGQEKLLNLCVMVAQKDLNKIYARSVERNVKT